MIVKTIKGVKAEKNICLWLGSIILVGAVLVVTLSPTPSIGILLGLLGVVAWIKMMYWQLILRLDKELK